MKPITQHQNTPSIRGLLYYARCKLFGRPTLLNLELTKLCNARCTFCACWKVGLSGELDDYSPIIKKFRPVVVSVSGGEPLLRKGYPEILKKLRPYCHFLSIITNGLLLNEDSAKKLVDSGVNQISVSLDYLGARHDEERHVKGLYDHISKMVPMLTRKGYKIALNTIIMESNLDEIISIAHRAAEWGATISFSAYCSLKRNDTNGMVKEERYKHLLQVVDEIKKIKRSVGHVKNSDHYLKILPAYFRDGEVPNCKAGYRWFQVTPDGCIQQCSELPILCHYTEFSKKLLKPATCSKCWYTCRGEAEASPLVPRRLIELIRS